ncbi:MAG: S1C family serine protease, partial [Betaproteobacteria bacterium]
MYRAILVGAFILAGAHAGNGLALEANEVFKRADPSVVVIVAEGAKRADDRLVSGVLIEPLDIVTNCRPITSAAKIVVKQGSVQRTAKLRYQDAARDLCQIRLDDTFPSGKPVTAYVLSKDLEVGQSVFAIGSPRGLEH